MEMAPKWILPVLVLISVSAAEILVVGQNETVLTYPEDFNSSKTWEINVDDDGLGVILKVNGTNLDSDDGDHLLFSADESMLGQKESVAYITGSVTDVLLAIPLVEKAYLKFSAKIFSTDKNVTITLKQYELRAVPPPVTPPNPYPPTGIDTEIAVHLTGKPADSFEDLDFLKRFQTVVQKAAFEFCERKKIAYNSTKPANETVFIRDPRMCSDKWPDYETCVQILIAIYVKTPRTDYELTVTHLREFWSEVEENGLPISLGVQPYEFPSVALQILFWVGCILVGIVITAVVGFILWRFELRAFDEKMRLLEEEEERRKESIFRGVELRRQQKPLKPSKHQKIPEFMKKNHDSISKASSTPTTKRLFLKGLFNKSEESKFEKTPSPTSPQVEIGLNRFWKPELLEEAQDE